MGTWQPSALQTRFSAKQLKHQMHYGRQDYLFLPLISSTLGVLHPDFLRLLWVIAGEHSDPVPPTDGSDARDFGCVQSSPRKLLFYKLRSRMAMAAARATAQRLLGSPGSVHYSHPTASYVPTDPAFLTHIPLASLHIGPVPGVPGMP
jgi:hypothetical protein